jgi:hypothetical protein
MLPSTRRDWPTLKIAASVPRGRPAPALKESTRGPLPWAKIWKEKRRRMAEIARGRADFIFDSSDPQDIPLKVYLPKRTNTNSTDYVGKNPGGENLVYLYLLLFY